MFALSLEPADFPLTTEFIDVDFHRPGLALAGFTEVFSYQRIQVIGTSEHTYLESIGSDKRQSLFHKIAEFRSPLWILTHDFAIPQELQNMCLSQNVPVMVTRMPTSEFTSALENILQDWFSPFCILHGTLVDVYGVGMLYTGVSGVGKSECALDLVERGHRLVADDMVKLIKSGNNIVGRGNEALGHHMEIRGVGIVDVGMLFGIRAIRDRKKVEIIVELQNWNEKEKYDRTGLDEITQDIMGIPISKKIIPISPGKNITVISEVIAMNMLLKMNGVDVAKMFNDKLLKKMQHRNKKKAIDIFSSEIY